MCTRRLVLTAALVLLSGCATAPAPSPPPVLAPTTPLGELEPLYGVEAGRNGLSIRVASNGCTTKADFAHFVERRNGAVSLAFGRKRLDPCKSFAMGQVSLVFTYEELGLEPGAPIFLLNPLTPWTGPGG
jgi:hypothetical protein